MAITDETRKTINDLSQAAADIVATLPVPGASMIAGFLRRSGGGVLAAAAEVLGIQQIIRVEVQPGATAGGTADYTK